MPTKKHLETEAKIRELRQSIDELEQQLMVTRQAERAQHKTLDHLDEYIDAVDTKTSSLKLFWAELKREWLSL
ncbi:Uncharacterised protein [Zhongshania aliphaticivorans]|uniref:Uncharacterized protein n=1 Tax=Zhongshania aliphaticivorans TaxID=1470434 RepID=A0A5S9MQ00_9GAMM|nr:hypothetical protein [Zhongshania aliphaticivorans]CAA0078761.1 Uncharacterised protein [Zhongshania aliphaticivorans]CAA0086442.1 Uncharacterised protein [Zhongshania aliphaticivorans]